jgi:hypothetical protein
MPTSLQAYTFALDRLNMNVGASPTLEDGVVWPLRASSLTSGTKLSLVAQSSNSSMLRTFPICASQKLDCRRTPTLRSGENAVTNTARVRCHAGNMAVGADAC